MDLARLLAQIDDTLLGELFSANALTRARAYVARVRNIETAGNQIQGLVQGTDTVPYRVTVRIERREFFGKSSIELSTRCTCPVGHRCKHAAALILAARRPGTLVDRPRAEILAWAIQVGKAVGVISLACAHAHLTVTEYSPAKIKDAVTGYGNADKAQVQLMVRNLLNLEETPRPDHAADSLAVAITHFQHTRYQQLFE